MGKVVAIIQARMGSTRLPGKVLLPLGGKPMIVQMVERVKRSALVDEVCVAVPFDDRNAFPDMDVTYFAGSEDDVLDRYYNAAQSLGADHIVRLTADCPLIDPNVIDNVIDDYLFYEADYTSNVDPPEHPDGMDVEVFSFSMLEDAWTNATSQEDREHVTTWIQRNTHTFADNSNVKHSDIRLTVDYIEDYQAVRTIWDAMPENFTLFHILRYLREHPEVRAINSLYKRNTKEGA
jgi:spore coat polysaccharide biosynthesis protein SpsF (cytidylyltransferase family)